jgi:hypothetical protein
MAKSRARLDDLTGEQQELVCEHCDRPSCTLEAGAKWLASEFDITLSAVALGKWLERKRIERSFAQTLSSIRSDAEKANLVGEALGSVEGITSANVTLISQAVFEEMRKPEKQRNIKTIYLLMQHALKAREQDLKQRSLDLEIEKFKSSIRTKLESALDALGEVIQGNKKALQKYNELKEELAKAA